MNKTIMNLEKRKYKESIFNYYIKKDNFTYIYNTLHSSFVQLNNNELPILDNISKELIENGFIVLNDFDEMNFLYNYRFKGMHNRKRFFYRIMTTGLCNARCSYCFEKNITKKVMSDSIANDVASFILANVENGYNSLIIEWFGGEPLLNCNAIDIITKRLKKNSIKFVARIITNGSLITPELAKKMKKDWDISFAQITLDGTDENYKRIKNYYDSNISLMTIVNNIKELLKNNIYVSIRLSVDKNTFNDCKLLVKRIEKHLRKYKGKYNIYPGFIFDCYKSDNDAIINENDEQLIYDFQKFINSYGYQYSALGKKLKSKPCQVCNINNFYITTEGDLFKCAEQHSIDSTNPLANIYNFNLDQIKQDDWINAEVEDGCKRCLLLPLCQGGCHIAKLYNTTMRKCYSSMYALEKYVLELIKQNEIVK